MGRKISTGCIYKERWKRRHMGFLVICLAQPQVQELLWPFIHRFALDKAILNYKVPPGTLLLEQKEKITYICKQVIMLWNRNRKYVGKGTTTVGPGIEKRRLDECTIRGARNGTRQCTWSLASDESKECGFWAVQNWGKMTPQMRQMVLWDWVDKLV